MGLHRQAVRPQLLHPSERAWINGGSPTEGFLSNIDAGPFASTFRSWAGDAWADWMFMLGLLAIGVAVVLGIGLRLAAVSGTVLMAHVDRRVASRALHIGG